MLKGLRTFPFCIKSFVQCETFKWCGKKSPLLVNCRCLYLSYILQKKSKQKDARKDESDIQRLEREAPFFYKAIKISKQGVEPKVINYETPIIFQPIHVQTKELVDDLSHFGHVKATAKIENVYVVQPNFKWGKERMLSKLVKHRLAEAEALITSVHTWAVHTGCIEPVQELNPKFYFGSGKVLELSEKIRNAINNDGVTMVFLNTGKLTLRQIRELEAVWGCKVFDRYRVVLELFKERARTKEAKLQVQLAEIQYMRTHLVTDSLHYDQQRGGGKMMSGGGETQIEKSKRVLAENERKTKKSLQVIKSHRLHIKAERLKKRIPQVAMVGYTNAGKTTLAKALSQDSGLEAEDKLFATLDTTAHGGKLPSGLNLIFIDTVGFISDLPHELVESFSTTLDDVKTADLLVHVADYSHPEFELQKETVENVLSMLDISEELMRSKITVLNKVDLAREAVHVDSENTIVISATVGTGIEELREAIEKYIIQSTGRGNFTINLNLQGEELSWLYRNGTVLDTIPHENGSLDVIAILDEANKNKYEKIFGVKLKR